MSAILDTRTQMRKIQVDGDLRRNLESTCDNMAAGGYLLSSSFVLENFVVLIFQLYPEE